MQPTFDSMTPVVDFGATANPHKVGERRWLLWPALAYRIILPARRVAVFNIFQRAILNMCRVGVRTPEAIANRLALPDDLVTFLIEQLRGSGMLAEGDLPTTRALRLLSDEDDPPEAEDAGYVFVDAQTKRLWPRLHRGSLPFVDAELTQGKSLRIQRGTLGRPEIVIARIISPEYSSQTIDHPSTLDILKAARQNTRRVRAFVRESSRTEGAVSEIDTTALIDSAR